MTVKLSHPHPRYGDVGATVDADPTTERVLVNSGWATWPGVEVVASTARPLYNPADHTVEEVEKYLDSADPTEHSRVLELERQGKNRNSLVG